MNKTLEERAAEVTEQIDMMSYLTSKSFENLLNCPSQQGTTFRNYEGLRKNLVELTKFFNRVEDQYFKKLKEKGYKKIIPLGDNVWQDPDLTDVIDKEFFIQ